MLLARDYVGYMATEIVKRLVEGGQIETEALPVVALRIRQRMNEELSVEDRLNDEVRQILTDHQDEMRRTGVSYQEMYKKVKGATRARSQAGPALKNSSRRCFLKVRRGNAAGARSHSCGIHFALERRSL